MSKHITRKPWNIRYTADCPVCGCQFEFDITDAEWYLREIANRDTTHIECNVSCPHCNTTLTDKQKQIK